MEQNQKSKLVVLLLAIFLGIFGGHNFYIGNTKRAVIQLCSTLILGSLTFEIVTIGIGIWAIIEGVNVYNGTVTEDANGVPFKD